MDDWLYILLKRIGETYRPHLKIKIFYLVTLQQIKIFINKHNAKLQKTDSGTKDKRNSVPGAIFSHIISFILVEKKHNKMIGHMLSLHQ